MKEIDTRKRRITESNDFHSITITTNKAERETWFINDDKEIYDVPCFRASVTWHSSHVLFTLELKKGAIPRTYNLGTTKRL